MQPENISRDCLVFCVFCSTEVNEKTARPRTFSPGNKPKYLTYVFKKKKAISDHWVTIHNARHYPKRYRRVPLTEVYSSISENPAPCTPVKQHSQAFKKCQFTIWIRYVRLECFPAHITQGVGAFRAKWPWLRDSRCAVWKQYPGPDRTVGVLTVPLKGTGYSFTSGYKLMVSHPIIMTWIRPITHYIFNN
jgi:hypothetical protein